jgi:aminotransferase
MTQQQGPTEGEKATQSRFRLMQLADTMEDVISFGAGDPDLHTPPQIVREAVRLSAAASRQSPPSGLPELRVALAEHYRSRKSVSFDPENEILITNGAQEALFLTMLALVDPGDRVLIPEPRYSSYDQAIEAAGGTIVALSTGENHRFELRPDELQSKAEQGKVLILVNPANPSGALVRAEDVRKIAEIARRARLLVVSDEVYESLTFDDVPYLSMVQCEGMRELTVTLSSMSKTYAMTGFRVGYLIGPPAFIEAATQLKRIASGPCPEFSQYSAIAALKSPPELALEIQATFAGRRKVMMQGLDSLGIPYGYPGGTFFFWADVSKFGMTAEDFCFRLLTEARVLFFPGTAFGAGWSRYVRISILQHEERIEEAIRRLGRFLDSAQERSGTQR